MATQFSISRKLGGFFATKGKVPTAQELSGELSQAKLRLPVVAMASIYVIVSSFIVSGHLEDWAVRLLAFYGLYTAVSLLILFLTTRYPGHYPVRRIFAMASDFAAASYSIIAGCTVMLPTYVFIVWVALGNGLRFGRGYLIIAAIMAQLALLTIFMTTPYWQADPIVALTLSVTALLVPVLGLTPMVERERAELATQEAISAKSRFLAQASHDLRQPIHAMNLFLNSLKQTKLTANQEGLVERLDRSLDGIAALFKSLLDLSSIDGGAIKPAPKPVSVEQLFSEIAQQFEGNTGVAGPRIRFAPSRRWLCVDPILLQTIIQNLISNALKHAPGAEILVGCRARGGNVSIMVSDRGPGIEAKHVPRLFDEFYQVRASGEADRSGVGLGLAIVRRLAGMMELRAEIMSVRNRGTTVYIHGILDAAPPAKGQNAAVSFPAKLKPLKHMRVLLVEDDIDVLTVTEELLRSWGCEVEASATLPTAPRPCDLVVTDFDIGGGVTGLDVIEIARHVSGHDIPAIIITGHESLQPMGLHEDNRLLLLEKPLKPAELRSAISTMRFAGMKH